MLLHEFLLDSQAWKLLDHRNRWRVPLSDQHLLLGRVYAHGEVEEGPRRRKPVRLLVRSGRTEALVTGSKKRTALPRFVSLC